MLVLGEHGLIDAAVEAAKLDPRSWQAAELRSVGGALGGVRSAAAALCFQLASEELPRCRCPVRATLCQTVARLGSIHGSIAESVSKAIVLLRLSQTRFIDWVHGLGSLIRFIVVVVAAVVVGTWNSKRQIDVVTF